MLNPNFKAAAKSAISTEKQRGNLWHSLVLFAGDVLKNDAGADVSEAFKEQEREAGAEMRVDIAKNSTFRSNKCVVLNAIEYKVALVDVKGKPRGKTEVEKDIAAAKGKKPAMSRFQTVLKSADSIADELTDRDVVLAAGLVQALLDKLTVSIKKAA